MTLGQRYITIITITYENKCVSSITCHIQIMKYSGIMSYGHIPFNENAFYFLLLF